MQVYQQEDALIERWQWNDPALRNLSDVVLGLLGGERGRALDLGCGTGRMAAELAAAGFQVDGIDVEERAAGIVGERHSYILFRGRRCRPRPVKREIITACIVGSLSTNKTLKACRRIRGRKKSSPCHNW